MFNFLELNPNRYICINASLSDRNKKELKDYFGTIYPREYVKKMVAFIDVQPTTIQKQSGRIEDSINF